MSIYKFPKLIYGLLAGRGPYTGPYSIQLDLTNACNAQCIYCMNYSPLGLEKEYDKDWQKIRLSLEDIKKLIPEFQKLDVRIVTLCGNGEPFMHPDILEIVRLIKSSNISCIVRTNGILINRKIIKELFNVGLDTIDLSLWAGTAKEYQQMHPQENQDTFHRIRDWLYYLNELKKNLKRKKPEIRVVNVIGAYNYSSIGEMLSFAYDMNINYVVFKYVVTGSFKNEVAKGLELTESQKKELLRMWDLSCYKNRVRTNFYYFRKELKKSFIPKRCYFGWLYTRLKVTGEVNPCCGCLDLEMGNFKETPLSLIWGQSRYQEFRRETIASLDGEYFRHCLCTKICPHWYSNSFLDRYFKIFAPIRNLF